MNQERKKVTEQEGSRKAEIAVYILSGGKNSRMGGRKKLFLEYEGEPFYQRILTACSDFENVYLSVEAEEPYRHLGLPLVADQWEEIGPMGGICSGLLQCPEEALLVLACDMPMVDRQTIGLLVEAYYEQETGTRQIVIAETEDGLHPLCGIYPRHILPMMQELIGQGKYRMMQLLKMAGYTPVPLDAAKDSVTNINTPEDLGRLQGADQK